MFFDATLHSQVYTFLRAFRKITKSDHSLRHICLSVRPHGATRLPIEDFD
jgi:hypothetical protein